jgi:hypothetical protein
MAAALAVSGLAWLVTRKDVARGADAAKRKVNKTGSRPIPRKKYSAATSDPSNALLTAPR